MKAARDEEERRHASGPRRGRMGDPVRMKPEEARKVLDRALGAGKGKLPAPKHGLISVSFASCPRCGAPDSHVSMGTDVELMCIPHRCEHGCECFYLHELHGQEDPCDLCISMGRNLPDCGPV